MRKHWGLFFVFRVAAMLALLALVVALWKLNRTDDPRFYLFLQSPPGRFLARVFHWSGAPQERVRDKNEREMTAEELPVKLRWEKQLAAEAPLHRLVLSNGQHLDGRLLQEAPGFVIFQEAYGDGGMTMRLERSRVDRIEMVSKPAYNVSYRDVRFRMEFPTLIFYKRPPFTLASDESFTQLEPLIENLEQVHTNFFSTFGALLARPQMGANIQVVFFSREDVFRSYQKRYAPNADNAIGFYSAILDRLVVFNAMGDDVEDQTLVTLRHEAAHQLFYTCGVHSNFRAENDWLVEGLAVYCETIPFGYSEPGRAQGLRKARESRSWIPLEQLVNSRSTSGLQVFESAERIDLAYRQSWALVCMFMADNLRTRFFQYLDFIRKPAHVAEVAKKPAWEILCREMEMPPAELRAKYDDFISNLQ